MGEHWGVCCVCLSHLIPILFFSTETSSFDRKPLFQLYYVNRILVWDSCVCLIFFLLLDLTMTVCYHRCVLSPLSCSIIRICWLVCYRLYLINERHIVVVVTSRMCFFYSIFISFGIVHIIFLVDFFWAPMAGDRRHGQKHSEHKQKSLSCTTTSFHQDIITVALAIKSNGCYSNTKDCERHGERMRGTRIEKACTSNLWLKWVIRCGVFVW